MFNKYEETLKIHVSFVSDKQFTIGVWLLTFQHGDGSQVRCRAGL